MAVLSGGLIAAWVTLLLTMPASVPADDVSQSQLALLLPLVVVGLIGLLLSIRRPENAVGWLLGSSALVIALLLVGVAYVDHWLYVPDLPASVLVPLSVISTLGWAAGFPMLLVVTPMVFPDGHLLSPRWRPILWLTVVGVFIGLVPTALDPQGIGDSHRFVANPVAIAGSHNLMTFLSGVVSSVVFIALMGAGLVSLGIRYRRADADLRRQLKWFIAAVTLAVATMMVALVTSFSALGFAAVAVGFTALPVSIAIAVFRYRLYNIDVVISRAVLFATMAVFITAVYVAVVVGIGTLVGSTGRANLVLSVLATAIVGLAFQPVFGRARRVANRLAYGNRATPYEVLSGLSESLAETYAGDDLLERMARTLAEATGATAVEVRLRVGSVIRSGAVWPPESPISPPISLNGQELPEIDGVDYALAVRHQGELLGALTVSKRPGESLTPMEQKLVADLAAQAGLLLKNAGLAADLQARLEDLRASRQRLVTAQDAERRRIERDLHDGAQQHLVALKVKLGLLASLGGKDPDRAAELTTEVAGDADEALQTLRDLARGIYPPLLADQGLVAAIEAQARKSAVRVEVQADGVGRYPQEIEAAVYFCCLEALQNVAKYSGVSTASVRLWSNNGTLDFAVRDDGAGFDLASTPAGSGLTNMADRIEALGGSFRITSRPGEGTQIDGSMPMQQTVSPGPAPDRAS